MTILNSKVTILLYDNYKKNNLDSKFFDLQTSIFGLVNRRSDWSDASILHTMDVVLHENYSTLLKSCFHKSLSIVSNDKILTLLFYIHDEII